MCKSAANWLDMHPEKMQLRLEKMFRQNWRRLSAIWQAAVTSGSNISFSQIFLSGCQEISVWSETNPVNRFVCVSFGPVWVWHGDTIAARVVLITRLDVAPNKGGQLHADEALVKQVGAEFKRRCAAFPLNLHPVRQITTVGCLITRVALSQEATPPSLIAHLQDKSWDTNKHKYK